MLVYPHQDLINFFLNRLINITYSLVINSAMLRISKNSGEIERTSTKPWSDNSYLPISARKLMDEKISEAILVQFHPK